MPKSKGPPKFIKATEPINANPSLDDTEELVKLWLVSVLAQLELASCFWGEAEPLFRVVSPIIDRRALP